MDYQTVEGEKRSIKLEGLGARCVQHEIDHLNGVIFLQRASQLKLERHSTKQDPKKSKKRLEYEQRRAIAEAFYEPQMLKNLLTQNECRQIIHFHKTHRNLNSLGDGGDYRGIRLLHIQTPWVRQLIGRVALTLIAEVYKTQGKIVYPEMIAINEWVIGGYQKPHLDTYSSQSLQMQIDPNEKQREWTCILYLNDNFQGGQTYVLAEKSMNQSKAQDYCFKAFI